MEHLSDNNAEREPKAPLHLLSEERTLPVISLADKRYKIDIANGELRKVDDPLRCIPFHAMTRKSNQYTFLYDIEKDKISLDKSEWDDLTTRQWVTLPSIEKLDPEFTRQVEKEEQVVMDKMKAGTSVYNTVGLYQPKDSGTLLPIVSFYGTDFFLNLRLKEFTEVGNPHNSIPWEALNPEDFHFSLLYDTQMKNAYQGAGALINESQHVKFLFLPPVDIMIIEGIPRHQKMLEAEKDKAIHSKVSKKRNFKR